MNVPLSSILRLYNDDFLANKTSFSPVLSYLPKTAPDLLFRMITLKSSFGS
nr:MAG TPA: hypothetical protein [Bacteriophage sp.]